MAMDRKLIVRGTKSGFPVWVRQWIIFSSILIIVNPHRTSVIMTIKIIQFNNSTALFDRQLG